MGNTKIVIAGPRGRMGSEAVKLVERTENFELAAVIDHKHNGKLLSELGVSTLAVPVYSDIIECLNVVKPDVLIDLTTPEVGMYHTKTALSLGVRPVVGTTGFTKENLAELETLCRERELGCVIAPNFALGAVLMMKFAQVAGKYFPDVEIIELHHDKKLDAPSGTSLKTAEMIAEVREEKKQGHPNEKETLPGARGADFAGMHIHSVRLPGLIAHEQVMFGAEGQSLSIRHDSYDRVSFMSGVKLAVDTVMKLNTFVYGLENIID
ncbi:4-hydroxy-tetrahydrodipicolinate reductase [Bacillus benzoevorans]|uniref:4-hydroxy-tetrahydrodipicolinate reductase n=1 Tax=Bacillus benzoevorans TaxID=1456 RepID=A0A7X0HSA5_9BACI|nr:4-hydroxy-tetrahydrodipicolinate reductase [Bacillus benzoevorans]MBB6444681.1 4-hydroxy-tetrahydrodipicolinate reductase [Bacillus benzoevorans]